MNLPGFTAEASLHKTGDDPAAQVYGGKPVFGGARVEIVPQLGISSDPDLGSYWRCRLNGGSDLICRFFGGLPPFTIGGLLFNR
ncbi:MAG TPA: hypothetical protein VFS90_08010 [Pyrinomonadaceae bacterium]|nr:hypothetical protein [Pyrinomonadaceae bacterium]